MGTPCRGGTGGPSRGARGRGGEGRGIFPEDGEGLRDKGRGGGEAELEAELMQVTEEEEVVVGGKKAWVSISQRERPCGGGSRWRGELSGSRGGNEGGLSGGEEG